MNGAELIRSEPGVASGECCVTMSYLFLNRWLRSHICALFVNYVVEISPEPIKEVETNVCLYVVEVIEICVSSQNRCKRSFFRLKTSTFLESELLVFFSKPGLGPIIGY